MKKKQRILELEKQVKFLLDNANYKKIIGQAFTIGMDYKSEELLTKISAIFNNEK